MKTQIHNLINGRGNVIRDENNAKYANAPKSTSHEGPAGTSRQERAEVAAKVLSENPESLDVEIKASKFHLPKHSSLSGKTIWYSCQIAPEDYLNITGAKELPYQHETSFVLEINGDMNVRIMMSTRHSGKAQWKHRRDVHIGEEFITIL